MNCAANIARQVTPYDDEEQGGVPPPGRETGRSEYTIELTHSVIEHSVITSVAGPAGLTENWLKNCQRAKEQRRWRQSSLKECMPGAWLPMKDKMLSWIRSPGTFVALSRKAGESDTIGIRM